MMKTVLDTHSASGEIKFTDGLLYWFPQFLTPIQADQAFQQMLTHLDWQQKSIRRFGKSVLQPRLIDWYGEKATVIKASLSAQPLPPPLLTLKTQCEQAAQAPFNSVLANLYRDGQDSIGWHQDNEPELGSNQVIASSLGESRRFLLRHHKDHALQVECELNLGIC